MNIVEEIAASSELLLSAHNNMLVDIDYLHTLSDQIACAKSRNVDTGNIGELLAAQMHDIQAHIAELSADLDSRIAPLVVLEESISTADKALVFTSAMTPVERFTAVHSRLKEDKGQLLQIIEQIEEWNASHDMRIEAKPATAMMQKIDDAYKVFNQHVKALVKKAAAYAALVKDEPKPPSLDVWAVSFVPHGIDGNTLTVTDERSPGLQKYIQSLRPYATRVYDQDESSNNVMHKKGHSNEWRYLYASKKGGALQKYNRWHSNLYSTSLYYKPSAQTCKLSIACYGLIGFKGTEMQIVLSKTELDPHTLDSMVFTDLGCA